MGRIQQSRCEAPSFYSHNTLLALLHAGWIGALGIVLGSVWGSKGWNAIYICKNHSSSPSAEIPLYWWKMSIRSSRLFLSCTSLELKAACITSYAHTNSTKYVMLREVKLCWELAQGQSVSQIFLILAGQSNSNRESSIWAFYLDFCMWLYFLCGSFVT